MLQVAQQCDRRDTFWLLGAGTMADMPLAELAAMFRRIIVFDIALLPCARRQARRFQNIELRLADITGIVEPLAEWQPAMPLPIPSCEVLRELDPVPPDGIVSLNLLSQLPLLPMDYLRQHDVRRAPAEAFGREIIEAHLAALSSFTCPVGLVTDATRLWHNRAGEPVMQENAVMGVRLPPAEREWHWPVAPRGEIDPELAMGLRVQAIRLVQD